MLHLYQNITFILEGPVKWLYCRQSPLIHILTFEERQQRFGIYSSHILQNAPYDIWMHAASVGEVSAASAILHAVKRMAPETRLLLSVFTVTGYRYAMKELTGIAQVVLAPFDLPRAAGDAFKAIQPRIYASVETELWPNMLLSAKRRGIRTVLLNARISNRSFGRYMRLKTVFGPILQQFYGICAISETYKHRLIQLGAIPDTIHVTGNAKFEGLLHKTDSHKAQEMKKRLHLSKDAQILVAGSIRGDEVQETARAIALLKQTLPTLWVFLAPRHLNRLSDLKTACEQAAIPFITLSDLENIVECKPDTPCEESHVTPVILVDRMGLLFSLYSIATVAFVGGSLVPKGGQNPMEPAAWACPVLFGPHMENFEEAKEALLRTEGAFEIKDARELADNAIKLLSDAQYRNKIGRNALKGLQKIAIDAATHQAEYILMCLEKEGIYGHAEDQ
jgi:3-deoxy-D-manno-octulosonic-acid transferase